MHKPKLTIMERVAAFVIAFLTAIPLGFLLMLMIFAAGLAVLFGIEGAGINKKEKDDAQIDTRE